MIVAITGGTGFIGKKLVARHLEAGDTVRVLTRQPERVLFFKSSVQIYHGDFTTVKEKDLLPFVEGADVLYHCAGEIKEPSRMRAVHVDGTHHLIETASGKIGRWVQLSSVGAYGFRKDGIVTEETSLNPQNTYEKTKAESDDLAMTAAQRKKFQFSMLRPSSVFGCEMPNNSLRQWIKAIQKGLFFYIGSRGASANYIHVDNVVKALILCGSLPQAEGRVFNLSDHRTLEVFVQFISREIGKRPPKLRLPESMVRFLVKGTHIIPGIPLTSSRIDALVNRCVYTNDRIVQELGYSHEVSMEEGLKSLCASVV